MTERMLWMLVEEGKVASLDVVCVPGSEMVLKPRSNGVVVFVAFFDVGPWLLSVELLARVLQLYRVELA